MAQCPPLPKPEQMLNSEVSWVCPVPGLVDVWDLHSSPSARHVPLGAERFFFGGKISAEPGDLSQGERLSRGDSRKGHLVSLDIA